MGGQDPIPREKVLLKTPIGQFETTRDPDTRSLAFLGIPFAEPLNATMRWTVPQLSSAFHSPETHFPCEDYAPRCIQSGRMAASSSIPESEDCLNLNIWIPDSLLTRGSQGEWTLGSQAAALPVMVFIHGGGFAMGSNADPYIGGDLFNANDVILVAMNYRLGPHGFLSLPELWEENPLASNFGLLDQRVAIQWVIRYISHFGGDPRRITLSGESAGAISVLWQLSAVEAGEVPQEKISDYIQGAIVQSAPNLAAPPCTEANARTRDILLPLGCNELKGAAYLQCLRALDAKDITLQLPGFGTNRKVFWHITTEDKWGFVPCQSERSLFQVDPRKALSEGSYSFRNTHIMIGTCRDEGTLFSWLSFIFRFSMDAEALQAVIREGFIDQDDDDDASKVIQRYLSSEESLDSVGVQGVLDEILNDVYFQCGNRHFADYFSRVQTTYRYVFNHKPEGGAQHLGVYHAAELPFVFGKPFPGQLMASYFTSEEQKLSETINRYWSEFAHHGEPSGVGLSEWPAYDEADRKVLVLNGSYPVVADYKQEQFEFWESLYPEGIPFLGFGDEMIHESWDSFLINEGGYTLLRRPRFALGVVGSILFSLIALIGYCCCCKSSSTPKKKKE